MSKNWCIRLEEEFNILADEDCEQLYIQMKDSLEKLIYLLKSDNIVGLLRYNGPVNIKDKDGDNVLKYVQSIKALDVLLDKDFALNYRNDGKLGLTMDQWINIALIDHMKDRGLELCRGDIPRFLLKELVNDYEIQIANIEQRINEMTKKIANDEMNIYRDLEELIGLESPGLVCAFEIFFADVSRGEYPEIGPNVLNSPYPLVQTITELDMSQTDPFDQIDGINEITDRYADILSQKLMPLNIVNAQIKDMKDRVIELKTGMSKDILYIENNLL